MKTNKNEAIRYNLDYNDVTGIENYEDPDINKSGYKNIKKDISLLNKLPTVCGYKLYRKDIGNNTIKDRFIDIKQKLIIAVVYYKKIYKGIME